MQKKIFNTLFIAVFAATLGIGIITPLMPIYAESLGATGIWLGIIFSGFALARLVLLPIVGRISDRRGRKKFIVFGLLGYSIVSLFYLLAGSVYSLTAVRMIHGFTSAFVVPIAMAYVGETGEEGKEAVSMGTFNISLFLGMGAGPVLGGVLKDVFSMSAAFYAMAGLSLLAFFIALFFLPDKITPRKTEDFFSFKTILKNNVVKGLFFFRMTTAMGRASIMVFLPLFASGINISASGIGILFAVDTFFNVSLQRTFGKLADRYNKFYLIIIGSLIGGSALLLIPFTHSFRELIFISALMGTSTAIAIPSATAIAVVLGRNMGMGTLMSSLATAMSVGFVLSPLILGVIMDVLDITSAFYIASLMGFSGALFFYYFIRKELKTR